MSCITCTATAGGTTSAEGLNTDQIIGISVGLVGAAAAIVAAIITACKCCKFTFSSLATTQIVLFTHSCNNIRHQATTGVGSLLNVPRPSHPCICL